MQSVEERQREMVASFDALPSWQHRYRRIIELGRELAPIDEQYRVDRFRVKGCQSQVWLHATMVDGRVRFQADSDASIVRGLVAIVVRIFDGLTPQELVAAKTTFIDELGLGENLSQTRAMGLAAMIKQMKSYGAVFVALGSKAES